LKKLRKKSTEANKELDNLVGTRTRMMMSKLKKIDELPIGKDDDTPDPLSVLDTK